MDEEAPNPVPYLLLLFIGTAAAAIAITAAAYDAYVIIYILAPGLVFLTVAMYYRKKFLDALPTMAYGTGKSSTRYTERGYAGDMIKARGLMRERRYAEAVELYKSISAKAPREAEPMFLLAVVYEKMGQRVQAQMTYRKVVKNFMKRLGEEHPYIRESQEKS